MYASTCINYVTQHEHYPYSKLESTEFDLANTIWLYQNAPAKQRCRTLMRRSRHNSIHVEFNILEIEEIDVDRVCR